ncbi:MAG TPA: hypothetical protein VK140_00895 [Ktedonobacteraceae bacterium]|nr:hypothetical protein [Ktedonobacteraceae bacterium]
MSEPLHGSPGFLECLRAALPSPFPECGCLRAVQPADTPKAVAAFGSNNLHAGPVN